MMSRTTHREPTGLEQTMWIKICGITTPEDARVVHDCGANAIGLNFFRGSKRFVEVSSARTIRDAASDETEVIGVFVNAAADDVRRTVEAVGLTGVQFHGDESPATVAAVQQRLPEVKLIRAIRVSPDDPRVVSRTLSQLADEGISLDALLVDAFVPGEYGGTGHRVDSELLNLPDRETWPPLILAGGLTGENVAAAIRAVVPWGVDTASGVEAMPGRKSPDKVRGFVTAVRAASH